MSVTNSYDFSDPLDYDFDDSLIGISAGASLLLQALSGQTFNQDFSSDTGFTYDSDKSEFSGGQVQQKDKTPAGATCLATFNDDVNLTISEGVNTGTAFNGALVSGGRLDLTGGITKRVAYDAVGNADSQQTGAIKFKLTPNFSGSAGYTPFFVSIARSASSNFNGIDIYYSGTVISFRIRNWDGYAIFQLSYINSLVAGQTYEILAQWDLDNGENSLYLDGVRVGLNTDTGTRDGDINHLVIGSNNTGGARSDYWIDDFVYYDSVQETGASYTPGYTLPENRYLSDLITLPDFDYSGLGAIQGFTGFSVTAGNAPRYIINGLYYSGGWVASSDTWSTASDYATILANIATLPASDTITIKIVTNDGLSQMSVSDLTLTYTGQEYPTSEPTIVPSEYIYSDELENFQGVVGGAGNVGIISEIDSVKYYHDGASWVVSDGSYAQSNTILEIYQNRATFITEKARIRFFVVLDSDGTQDCSITSMTITSSFAPPEPSMVQRVCWAFTQDFVGDNADSVSVKIRLNRPATEYGNEILVINEKIYTVTSKGYFDYSLVSTDDMEDGAHYIFTVNGRSFKKTVPSGAPISIIDLPDYTV